MNTEKEKLLKKVSTFLLWAGCISGIICVFCCYPKVDYSREFQPLILATGIAAVLSSIVTYAFLQVIAEISLSLKNRKEDIKSSTLSQNGTISAIQSTTKGVDRDFVNPKTTETSSELISRIGKEQSQAKVKFERWKTDRWKLLKQKGGTAQAITEYREETRCNYQDAADFINSL